MKHILLGAVAALVIIGSAQSRPYSSFTENQCARPGTKDFIETNVPVALGLPSSEMVTLEYVAAGPVTVAHFMCGAVVSWPNGQWEYGYMFVSNSPRGGMRVRWQHLAYVYPGFKGRGGTRPISP